VESKESSDGGSIPPASTKWYSKEVQRSTESPEIWGFFISTVRWRPIRIVDIRGYWGYIFGAMYPHAKNIPPKGD
jgi:hypothetical protein